MRYLALGCIAVLFFSFTIAGEQDIKVERDAVHVEYHRSDGMVDGKYTSYWKNGKKKAEGEMRCNMRAGTWNLWDSTGKLVMTREYLNGLNWSVTFPKDAIVRHSHNPVDTTQTLWSFRAYTDDSILRTARLWRYIPADKESPMFRNHSLIDSIIALSLRPNGLIVSSDDEMRTLYSWSEFDRRVNRCDSLHIVKGYRIKEDLVLNYSLQTSYYGIITICPVLARKDGKDSLDLGWYNFSDLEPLFRQSRFEPAYFTIYPKYLSDQFTFRCFAGDVYRTSNRKNYELNELYSGDELAWQVQSWEWQPFEWEHDMWLSWYGKK